MSQRSPITLEHLLYFVILTLAFALRMGNLGSFPLSEFEAVQAMSAYNLAEGNEANLGAEPSYVVLSAVTFAFLGSSEFLARFWPAFLGTAFVLVPFALRGLLGRKVALLLSLCLAISPGFVATSRLASGAMFGVLFPLLAILLWLRGRATLAGIFTALALLSGTGTYIGMLGFILAWLIVPIVDRQGDLTKYSANFLRKLASSAALKPALLSFALTLLFGITIFMALPQALSGIGGSVAAFLLTWTQPTGLSVLHLPLALLGYSFPALLFGVVGGVKAWVQKDKFGQLLSLWAFGAFLLVIINPGRQMSDLLWVLLPLWTLTVKKLSRYLYLPKKDESAILGSILLILILGVFLWLNAAGMARMVPFDEEFNLRLVISGALLLLGAVAFILISYGWSRRVASFGLTWGLITLFLLFTLSADLRFVNQGGNAANELWLPGPAAGQTKLLQESMAELSDWTTGRKDALEVVILNESDSLSWAFRDWPSVRNAEFLPVAEQPAIILTQGLESQPGQVSAYRGQSFVWSREPNWERNLPANLFAWFIFREAPTRSETVALWARADMFPLSESSSILSEPDAAEPFAGAD